MIKRMNLSFREEKGEERRAYDFLSRCGRKKTEYMSIILSHFLEERGIQNPDSLSSKDIKELMLLTKYRFDNSSHTAPLQSVQPPTVEPEMKEPAQPTEPPKKDMDDAQAAFLRSQMNAFFSS